MAIASTIKEGATTVAASGGTDVVLTSLGIQGNTNTLYFSTDTNLSTRRLVKFTVKPTAASTQSPGGQTLARNSIQLASPKVLASTEKAVNTVKIEVSYHPETTQAEVEQLCETAAQMLGGANFMDFQKNQNLS
jgi:hypothetical protein